MTVLEESGSEQMDAAEEAADYIDAKAEELEKESRRSRSLHQLFTVLTVLLGVSAPALVTFTSTAASVGLKSKIFAVVITAFAAAAATLRTVLRFSERYSNSALTAIALQELSAELLGKRQRTFTEVKEEYKNQRLFEDSAWAKKQMFTIVKAYIEKDISVITQNQPNLLEGPVIPADQRKDKTLKD